MNLILKKMKFLVVILVGVLLFASFSLSSSSSSTKEEECKAWLVQSIPTDMPHLSLVPGVLSTADVFRWLARNSTKKLDIMTQYWQLVAGADNPLSGDYGYSKEEMEKFGAQEGLSVYKAIENATDRNVKVRLLQHSGVYPDYTKEPSDLAAGRPNVKNVTLLLSKWWGSGIVHVKVWISDERHVYIGSANNDWKSLTQVKEAGIYLADCPTIAKKVEVYYNNLWMLGMLNASAYTTTTWDQQWQINRTVPCWSHFVVPEEICKSPLHHDYVKVKHVAGYPLLSDPDMFQPPIQTPGYSNSSTPQRSPSYLSFAPPEWRRQLVTWWVLGPTIIWGTKKKKKKKVSMRVEACEAGLIAALRLSVSQSHISLSLSSIIIINYQRGETAKTHLHQISIAQSDHINVPPFLRGSDSPLCTCARLFCTSVLGLFCCAHCSPLCSATDWMVWRQLETQVWSRLQFHREAVAVVFGCCLLAVLTVLFSLFSPFRRVTVAQPPLRQAPENQKHKIPSPDDEVWRLCWIARNGTTHKRLEEHQIHKVKDHVVQYYNDQSLLRNILKFKTKKWNEIVEQAVSYFPKNACTYLNALAEFNIPNDQQEMQVPESSLVAVGEHNHQLDQSMTLDNTLFDGVLVESCSNVHIPYEDCLRHHCLPQCLMFNAQIG